MFLMYSTFSVISNFFNSGKPFALSTINRKCANKMHHICEALRIRFIKFKQNLGENYSKSTKIAIAACKFLKLFRGACPQTPLQPFLFLNQLQVSSPEKNTFEKNVEITALLSKFLATPRFRSLFVKAEAWLK